MRDVRSSHYFEQMKGRGCRVLTETEFRNVTPDGINKTRYVIVDAVGVTEHCKSDSPPLERQPAVPLKSILQAVAAGSTDPEVVSTLAIRLARLDRIIAPGQRQEIERLAGRSIHDLIDTSERKIIGAILRSLNRSSFQAFELLLSSIQRLRDLDKRTSFDELVPERCLRPRWHHLEPASRVWPSMCPLWTWTG